MRHARITATGCYLPEIVLTNRDVIERFGLDVDEAWIEARTGIRSRHWMRDDQTTSDLAVEAARAVLAHRGIEARDLDRIVLATISGDYPSPATATVVARKLGTRCPAFDISAACTGFLYALDLAAASVRGGEERVLVLCADARSRFIDKHDRRSVVLFADGAAGALIEASGDPGLLGVVLGAEGRERMGAWVPAGGAALPASHETVEAGRHYLQVDGLREIFDLFTDYACEAARAVLAKTGLRLDDVDVFITHQGNAFLIDEIAAKLGIPAERTVNGVAKHGNTSGASVPIALAEAVESGRIRPGHVVLFASAGAGYTFGAAVHRF